MSVLTMYGVTVLTFMMVMYALEDRGRHFILPFTLGCALSSSYGFVSGAWGFGVLEGIWCLLALLRYHREPSTSLSCSRPPMAADSGRLRRLAQSGIHRPPTNTLKSSAVTLSSGRLSEIGGRIACANWDRGITGRSSTARKAARFEGREAKW